MKDFQGELEFHQSERAWRQAAMGTINKPV